MTTDIQTSENGFAAFDLPHALAKSLAHMKYENPTPVQAQAIPAALKGKDVLASAQTGTGKTGAFIIPTLARLMRDPHAACLIMTPTRELAAQILVVARQMLHQNNTVKTALLIGGESMGRQRAQLSAKPRLIVGTPGRINDHLRDRPTMLQSVTMLVLDEADRMLDMGFTPQINAVIKHMTAPNRQTLMFSATFPKEIVAFTHTYMRDPVRVTIEPERTSAANIIHETREVNEKTRYEDLMDELYNRKGSIIVFIKTKHGADKMQKRLEKDGHSADVIHGGLSQGKRDRAIAAFRAKKTRIMVATDVAARGLDVPHIEHVINYDLPQVAEDYVHRIGRTARNGQEGRAMSFLMPSERGKWSAIQRTLNPQAKAERPQRNKGGNRNAGKPKREFGHMDRDFEEALFTPEQNPQGQQQSQHQGRRKFRDRHPRFADKSHLIDPPMSASAPHAPRNDGDFNTPPPARMERGERSHKPRSNNGPRREFRDRNDRNDNQHRDFNRARPDRAEQGFKKARPERNGNVRRDEHEMPERNFNVEGASGEGRFDADNNRPFQHERKPQGAFWQKKKKKFFSKDRKQNGQRSGRNFKKSA